jgi:hypothetical protein
MFGWVTFLALDFRCILSLEVDAPNLVMNLNWTPIYEWYVV